MTEKYANSEDLDYFHDNVVEKNFAELMSLIEKFSEDKFNEDILKLNDTYDIGERGEANKRFSRLFYNYITSSFGLINQIENFSEDAKDKKEEIFSEGQRKFLRELRNFVIHKTKPPIDSRDSGGAVFLWKKRKFEISLEEGFLKYLDKENRGREKSVREYLGGKKVVDAELELRKFHNSLSKLAKYTQEKS